MATPTEFTAVTTEGGLLPADLIERLVRDTTSLPGTGDSDYRLTPGTRLREIISRSYADLLGAWETFEPHVRRLDADDHSAALTRDRWLLPLFSELGYGRLDRRPGPDVIGGKEYPVTHQHDQALVHLVGWNVPLDQRTPGVAGAARSAPHSMVQELLNRSTDHLWAVVSNGRQLRILRDNSSLTRAAYVEFDLETIFSEGAFNDFVALWLLVHATRLEGDPQSGCWLEQWATEAREQGIRALESLGTGFESAIAALGAGFLAHPANTTLRTRLHDGDLDTQDYYRQLLRVVYRLVFLLVAEDRNLLHPDTTPDDARDRYRRYYSLSRIRDFARRHRGTRHSDLWQQITLVTRGLHDPAGLPALGLPALGSALWDPATTADLDHARLSNLHLLTAIRSLAYTRREHALQLVNYRLLDSEELGSVYESLLELRPEIDPSAATFTLRRASGNERKTSGSYYTPTPLIAALLDVSLDHLLDDADQADDPEAALLDLKVMDPACGSGHFLVAAARRIARRLASHRTGEPDPTPAAARHALRDVVAHCVFGIDLNPMAVELCKVSLWLEAVDPGRPLSFLDHHIVCGNALLGATPRLLDDGLPDSAFTAIEGDDKPTVTARRKTNAHQRKNAAQGTLALSWDTASLTTPIAHEITAIEAIGGDTPGEVAEQADRYQRLQSSDAADRARLVADAWCAAVMAVKDSDHPAVTDQTIRSLADNPAGIEPATLEHIRGLAHHYRFLHWHLAFPQVFTVDSSNADYGWTGGFDLILGNPPWDTMSPDAKEFFAAFEPQIRFMRKAEQQEVIDELTDDPGIADQWRQHRRDLFASAHFMKNSGRYRLFAPGNLGKGDFNIYRMFVETALTATTPDGWAAQVTPSGLYNGANAAGIRTELFDRCRLETIYGFINTGKRWFPDIHAETRFATYSAKHGGATTSFSALFGIEDPQQLQAALRDPVEISADTVRSQSPEALAISETATGPDADITAKIYAAWPAFGEVLADNPHRQYAAEIHMGNDRDLFNDTEPGLPLYEGRMIDQYDHRAKAYRSGRGRAALWESLPFGSPAKAIIPQWRVPPRNVPAKVGDRIDRYRVAFCDVTSPQAERSLIAALVPPGVICGHKAPTIAVSTDSEWSYVPWLASMNSFCVDFLSRKKIALTMALNIVDSLPIARLDREDARLDRLGPLVLRLTCTSPEMTSYWNAMSAYGWCDPVPGGEVPAAALIDPEARADARAEIDAILAKHVYGLTADELAYVLDQFPMMERREVKAFGSFVTRQRVLSKFAEV